LKTVGYGSQGGFADRQIEASPFNIQHSTFNIQHWPFSVETGRASRK